MQQLLRISNLWRQPGYCRCHQLLSHNSTSPLIVFNRTVAALPPGAPTEPFNRRPGPYLETRSDSLPMQLLMSPLKVLTSYSRRPSDLARIVKSPLTDSPSRYAPFASPPSNPPSPDVVRTLTLRAGCSSRTLISPLTVVSSTSPPARSIRMLPLIVPT